MGAAWSQAAATFGVPPLAPSLGGTAQTPPVFRQSLDAPAGTGRVAQQANPDEPPIGEIPTYGDQPGSGAGATGFDSSNTLGRTRKTGQTPGAAASPQSGGQPAPAPPTTSAISAARLQQNQNRTRHGAAAADASASAVLAPAPPTALPPLDASDPSLLPRTLIRKPAVDDAPFDPVGIQAGSFLLRPAIEFTGGYDTNPARAPTGGGGSAFAIVAPELQATSNWERHQLTANLRSSFTAYGSQPTEDRPFVDGKIDGRIDVTALTRIDLEARTLVSTDNPGSPNIQAGLAKLPIYADVGGSAGVGQRFNRFDFELKGGFDRTTYQASTLTDGTTSSNDDRNFDQYSGQLRAGYDVMPGVQAFVEGDLDQRVHDLSFDRSGFDRDSTGRVAKLGSTLALSPILTGQVAFGYMSRSYRDPRLPDLQGPAIDFVAGLARQRAHHRQADGHHHGQRDGAGRSLGHLHA